jgi:integrase
MATVNYYLKGAFSKDRLASISDKKLLNDILDKEYQIYLKLSSGGERIQIYTKKRIAQKHWDFDKQEVDCQKMRLTGLDLNKWLKSLREDVLSSATENELAGRLTSKKELEDLLSGRSLQRSKEDDFESQFKRFLSQHKTGDGSSLRSNTLKKYTGLLNHLKEFSNETNRPLIVKFMNKTFLQEFKDFLSTTQKLNDNSVAKYVKAFKPFLRYHINLGTITPFSLAEIKSSEKEGEIFVVPIKSVLELQKLPLKLESLKHARDIFCFMCWTGQRYSDYESLEWEDFSVNEKGEKIWNLVSIKTHTAVSVPIIGHAEDILKRYKGSSTPLPRLSNQKMNEYLKELGKAAKLNHSIKQVSYYDGKKVEEVVPFYEVLTTHVARKSFITNSLVLGVPERVVREVSGHKDEKSFRRYVNLADNYKSSVISKAFSKSNIEKVLEQL